MPVLSPYHLLPGLVFFIPALCYYHHGKIKPAFLYLLAGAFVLRLVMICLDPYLHEWDEQYHAVVAKGMMTHPFRPSLREAALLPYTMTDWCCNYIWLHKQPLFMWQMALSMKVFGVNTIALRLPNVILGTAVLWPVFRIAQIWSGQNTIAFLAAFFYALSFQVLELSSGRLSLEHNDLMFGFYITGSIWAFCEYSEHPKMKWAILIGVLAGCAILIKWLTGLLVFGGWGLYLLTDRIERLQLIKYIHGLASIAICTAVFLPWQIYIRHTFPSESAASYAYFEAHIYDDLGHPGNVWFYIKDMNTAYGIVLLPFMVSGLWQILKNQVNKRISIALLSMFAVVYLFFSLIVATKMPGFMFPVAAIGFILIAVGFNEFVQWIQRYSSRTTATFALGFFGILTLQPQRIIQFRSDKNLSRNALIDNTLIYRQIPEMLDSNAIIFNCKAMQDPAVRFWTNNNAYQLFPESAVMDSLLDHGYKVAAFDSHHDQVLPEFWRNDPRIKKIGFTLK